MTRLCYRDQLASQEVWVHKVCLVWRESLAQLVPRDHQVLLETQSL